MVRLPHPSDKPRSPEHSVSKFLEITAEISPELEERIQNADWWVSDWELRELEFERDARQTEHGMYIAALHEVCRGYCQHTLNTFTLGIARWLEKEVEKVDDNLELSKEVEFGDDEFNEVLENDTIEEEE